MNEEKTEEKLVKEKLEKNEKLTKIKQEYSEVKSFMENLNNNLKVEVLVPIAENLAFFKGLIKHTNECTIYLGDDYYAQTVNKKAIEIIDNRLKNIQKIQAEDEGNFPIETIILPKEKESDHYEKNLRKLDDGTVEIFEEIDQFPQAEIVSTSKTVQVSQQEKDKIKQDRELLWQEKLKRMKILAEMEEAEERNEANVQGANYKQIEGIIKSPKDIYNLMTTVRLDNDTYNVDKQEVIQTKNNHKVEHNINIVREINPEVKDTKKITKKKDIITTDLNLGSHNKDDTKVEKRSLFFEEDQKI
jgi:prefoldin subunit 5